MEEEQVFYVHSKCCNAHWELVWVDGKYQLVCELCGNNSGMDVTGPDLSGEKCAGCGGDLATGHPKQRAVPEVCPKCGSPKITIHKKLKEWFCVTCGFGGVIG